MTDQIPTVPQEDPNSHQDTLKVVIAFIDKMKPMDIFKDSSRMPVVVKKKDWDELQKTLKHYKLMNQLDIPF